ncbi:ferritin-like domain-containing protein [Aldersonia sp. NBC_00410]|uniref:ferritin-like domain-containing protein n=1 Tax=Aldersonia sp. NBC_00410 TaxID=2975954 RepID=UPI00225661E2|nr:ferritin-like domain-containing protein [Aldersonia sp. NBC_00410]MCX5046180.1 ferritin-like domain-containing protein [Aldersonia sp. NBC_00410]
MPIVLEDMLATIKERQWALADIDWAAPGAELITEEQKPKLKAFMADLVWIENIGARGFAAMAKKAPDPTLAEIFRYFHAEEQKHANAELALMHRWDMLADDEVPEPNVNIRLAIEWLDTFADRMSLSVLGTVIPMLEVALDGALLKFLLEEVHDPVCHAAFRKINADESRHIAVDFHVLDLLGQARLRSLLIQTAGTFVSPGLLIGALMYVPLLNKVRDNIVDMGLSEDRLYEAMKRFKRNGERGQGTRILTYQVLKLHAGWVIDRGHPYHLFADAMVRLTDHYPQRLLRPQPSWSKELTYEAVA